MVQSFLQGSAQLCSAILLLRLCSPLRVCKQLGLCDLLVAVQGAVQAGPDCVCIIEVLFRALSRSNLPPA